MKARITESTLIPDGVKVMWSDDVEFLFETDEKATLIGYNYDPPSDGVYDLDEIRRREAVSRTSALVTLSGVGV